MLPIVQKEIIDLQALKIALRDGFDPESEETREAFQTVIEKVHLEAVKLFLEKKLERAKGLDGEFLFHKAVFSGNTHLVATFIASRDTENREADDQRVKDLLHLTSDKGVFPLAVASINDDQDMMDYLLVSGAEAGYENQYGTNAAGFSAFEDTMEALEEAVELQKNPDQSREPSSLSSKSVTSESNSHCCHIL